ncbi:hypothetical protein HRI_003881500 [Hibiscus trionum]|uniref:Uncharacterized protein n=1 Tax=Hibiscus trionum TaxID=183268 RepID=A0A9W7MFG9_HIBTR|nr:hypothetical protein HRI_003881500 [Hibiscus trionum]
MIMKNSVMIFLALVLLLTTLGVDGQAGSRLGRKADAGGAAAASLVAVSLAAEEDDDTNPTFSHYGGNTDPTDLVHHVYINGTNPYAPKNKKSP